MQLYGSAPKYHQLGEILRDKILRGEFAPNDQFPTEESLSEEFNVSRGTVRKAIDLLHREGLIRKEQGRGTFINPPQPKLNAFTLNETIRAFQTQTLVAETIPANESIAAKLNIKRHEPVIYIAQLQLADGKPLIFEERYLAQSLCPNLLDQNLEEQPLHWLLINQCHIPLIRVTHTIEIRPLDPQHAAYLQLKSGTPAFFVDRLTFTRLNNEDHPAVWYQATYHGDEYQTAFQASL